MESYFVSDKPLSNEPLMEVSGDLLCDALYRFIGISNVSLNAVVSQEFRHFAQSLVDTGKNNPNAMVEHLLPIRNVRQFRNAFVQYESAIQDKYIQQFRGAAALAIDAAKICNRNVLNIMLINTRLDIPPILYKSIRDFDSRSIGYRKEIRQAVVELQQHRIIICGITTDNLKAQVMAFGKSLNGDEVIERGKDPMQCLRRVPCQCHTMSLVINDLISRSVFQNDYILIEKAVNFVRKKLVSSRIGSICPSICRTRWRNLFLIFKWFKNNYEKIHQFLIESGPQKHYVLAVI
jgi:hypothetical protein